MPQKANIGELRNRMRDVAGRRARYVKSSYEQTVTTWEGQPTFQIIPLENRDVTGFTVDYLLDEMGEIYKYLDFGTTIRWSLMSTDWISKTSPNTINPGTGRGYVRLRGRAEMEAMGERPRPGIKARNWTTMFRKDARFYFYKEMQELFKNWRMFS